MINVGKCYASVTLDCRMCPVALEMNVIYKKKINVKSLRKMFLCTPRVSTPD